MHHEHHGNIAGETGVLSVLACTRYERRGASSRHRILQFLPWLAERGVSCEVAPLLGDRYLDALYARGSVDVREVIRGYTRRARQLRSNLPHDLVWVQQDFFPWVPHLLESRLRPQRVPFVLDIDDAFFHRYDAHRNPVVRAVLGKKLDRAMADAALVIAGNRYLAERATGAGAHWVEILPTVVDLRAYESAAVPVRPDTPCTIVWIGSPTTAVYLRTIGRALRTVQERIGAHIRVIGAPPDFSLEGVRLDLRPWNESAEIPELLGADIGIMPLLDTPWERGKCGFKLIQYMAAGLPVVGSPVGVNEEIIDHGTNGFRARSEHEWADALVRLGADPRLRRALGGAGRETVRRRYSLDRTAPRLEELLRTAVRTQRPAATRFRSP